jgi:hypothetical protein
VGRNHIGAKSYRGGIIGTPIAIPNGCRESSIHTASLTICSHPDKSPREAAKKSGGKVEHLGASESNLCGGIAM